MAKITMTGLLKLNESGEEGKLMVNAIIHQAFTLVEDRSDWKAPIDKTLDMGLLDFHTDVIKYAIGYMTATDATVTFIQNTGKVRFQSIGYRAGPAGP